MYDQDGRFTYSSIVRTGNRVGGNKLVIYPNPATSLLNITAHAGKDELVFFRLMNMEGKVVDIKQTMLKKGSNTFSWNIAQLAVGTYFISSTNKTFGSMQIIKQ